MLPLVEQVPERGEADFDREWWVPSDLATPEVDAQRWLDKEESEEHRPFPIPVGLP